MFNYTADLCDAHSELIKVVDPIFKSYGLKKLFSGEIVTVKVHEDNALVKNLLNTDGNNKVLVIDGGGSLRCALVGGNLAQIAADYGWQGIIVYGCIRDSEEISKIPIGIKALNTHPLKSIKHGRGDIDIPVTFAGVTFFPKHYLYADFDGVIVAPHQLI